MVVMVCIRLCGQMRWKGRGEWDGELVRGPVGGICMDLMWGMEIDVDSRACISKIFSMALE